MLDRHCIRCHGGGEADHPPQLTGEPSGVFSRAYENLRPLVRWHEWGGESISQIVTRPGRQGADESPLLAILTDSDHAQEVRLSDQDLQRNQIWLDANAPFYGTYDDQARRAQLAGEPVPPPPLQ